MMIMFIQCETLFLPSQLLLIIQARSRLGYVKCLISHTPFPTAVTREGTRVWVKGRPLILIGR
jgi:hypothetical protein